MTLVTGTFFYHQYFSFLTLLMFNSIDFSLPPRPSALPPLFPYIENPAAAHVGDDFVCRVTDVLDSLLLCTGPR